MLGNRFLLVLLVLSALAVPCAHGQSHFTSCLNGTGNVFNATVIVPVESAPNVSGVPLAPGSEIAVFSSDPQYPDLCVGLVTWQGSHSFINVWGDDEVTPGRDGLLAGEVMDYRLWDQATDTEYAGASVSVSYALGDGLYDNDAVYVVGDLSASASVNDAPVVTTSAGETAFTEGLGPVVVDSSVTVTDLDDTTLVSATVEITNLLDGADEVLAATPSGAIGADAISYVAPTLTITAGGGAPLADFQAVLQRVRYDNAAEAPDATDRVLAFTVNDGTDSSNVGQKTVIVTPVEVMRFVAITGNDAGNDCTDQANPCATIAHAVSQAINGDTLVVASGTYIEPDLVIDKALNIQWQGVIVR